MTNLDVLDLSAISPPRERALLRTKKNPEGLRPDGTEYELANLEDFSPVQITTFNAAFGEAEELWTRGGLDKAATDRMEKLFTDLAMMVILDAARVDVRELPVVVRRGVALRFWATLSLTTYSTMGAKAVSAMGEMVRRVNANGSALS